MIMGGSGHVAIVEEIASDGTITCSNSAWRGTYFFLTYITPVNGRYNWSHYTHQGFIYNPYSDSPTPPIPPIPPITRHGSKWNRRIIKARINL